MIGLTTSIADRVHRLKRHNPGPAIPDGDGGSASSWVPLLPLEVSAAIRPPRASDLERLAAGTVISTAMRVIAFPFDPLVTTATRVLWTDPAGRSHVASVTGVDNPDGRCVETVLLAVELLDAPPPEDTSWIQQGWLQ
jgi:hypothetical protein